MKRKLVILGLWVGLSLVVGARLVTAQGPTPGRTPNSALGTGFTYQGQLKQSGLAYTGTCDMRFSLWDAAGTGAPPIGGNQIGTFETLTPVTVTNGLFMVTLNNTGLFGANAFNGEARWLQIAVRCPVGVSGYTILDTRQPVSATPYALYALKTRGYQNVLVVAKSGGDYTTITDALNSISANSATNPFVIWVAPGIYTETVTMKSYVDIEGAGEGVTKITQVGSTSNTTGTVSIADKSELRFLTVENTGGSNYAIAVYNSTGSPRLSHITANAFGGTTNRGVYNNGASASMNHVTVSAQGGSYAYGMLNSSADLILMDVIATGSGAVTENAGVVNTTVKAKLMNVIATGSGGSRTYGVENSSTIAITMSNVIATGSDGSENHGIRNGFCDSAPLLTNVIATATGGTDSRGIDNYFTSAIIQNSTINARGATSNYGIYNEASLGTSGVYTVTVNNSQVTASTATIYNQNTNYDFTTRVGTTLLNGGTAIPNGSFACVFTYNSSYIALSATCQ